MSKRSTHLVAIGTVTNIPINGTWSQLTLADPNGVAITGNTLPGQCTMMEFSATGFLVGVDKDSTPTWQTIGAAQAQELNVVLGGAGKKVAVTSQNTALTGVFQVLFYA